MRYLAIYAQGITILASFGGEAIERQRREELVELLAIGSAAKR